MRDFLLKSLIIESHLKLLLRQPYSSLCGSPASASAGEEQTSKTMFEVTVTRIRHKKGDKVKLGAFMSCPAFTGKIKKKKSYSVIAKVRGKLRR